MNKSRAILGAVSAGIALGLSPAAALAAEVNIYSYRQPDLIAPLLEAFTEKTGIKTNVLFLNKGLEERVEAEGVNSPVDVIFTVDIGRLTNAKAKEITQSVENGVINENIPEQYRDPAGHWFGLTTRGRVVYASRDRVAQDEITYEELADPKWKGKICIRSGQHAYNVALIASVVANLGEEKAKNWLEGVKANLARKPAGNDRAQAKGIFSGECDLGIGNTYYVGLMQNNEKEPEQKEWAKSIKVLFPNAGDRGTHVNVSGMALAKNSPNKENALKLMEFLASPEGQEIYAERVYEYPIGPGTSASDTVKGFGKINPDSLSLETIAKNRKRASELVDEVGFDDGPSS
ncbi:MAG: Fe(3+) ABC transporter substrate-binding protein [Rhizobiaceae bacterium]